MKLSDSEKEKLKILIALYIKTDESFWSETDWNKFRQWYYELFLESFGHSRKCKINAINKLNKEINRVP